MVLYADYYDVNVSVFPVLELFPCTQKRNFNFQESQHNTGKTNDDDRSILASNGKVRLHVKK